METDKCPVERLDRFARFLGVSFDSVEDGHAILSLDLKEEYQNGWKSAQGGVVYTLADLAFAAATNTDEENLTVTTTANINYIRPARTAKLVAEAATFHRGGKTVICDVTVRDDAGNTVAVCRILGFRVAKGH